MAFNSSLYLKIYDVPFLQMKFKYKSAFNYRHIYIPVVSSVNHMTDMWLTAYKIFEHQISKSELKGQTSSFKVFV